MEGLKELPREVQVTLVALILFIVFSFFDWQQVSVGPFTAGRNLWHGIGIITVLIAIAYLIWEIGRVLEYDVNLGQVTPEMTSVGFAAVLLLFTIITFLDWNDFRHWPEWLGLLLSLVIAGAAFMRARSEGVELPKSFPGRAATADATPAQSAPAEASVAPPVVEPPASEPPASGAGA
jgi:hypothetical protein